VNYVERLKNIITNLNAEYEIGFAKSLLFRLLGVVEEVDFIDNRVIHFSNSKYFLHVLDILQEGFIDRYELIPVDIVEIIENVVLLAFKQNSMREKIDAITHCAILSNKIRSYFSSFLLLFSVGSPGMQGSPQK